MDTKKVVIVLLIIAIVFSVGAMLMNKGVDESFVASNSNGGTTADSGNLVGVNVLDNNVNGLVLGVFNGL